MHCNIPMCMRRRKRTLARSSQTLNTTTILRKVRLAANKPVKDTSTHIKYNSKAVRALTAIMPKMMPPEKKLSIRPSGFN